MAPRPKRMRLAQLGPVAVLFVVGFAGVWSVAAEKQDASRSSRAAFSSAGSCHPSYSGRCLPIGPDLDCRDVGGPVRVVGPDLYRLDRDRDGIGCE